MADIAYNIQAQISKGALSQTLYASGITADIATAGIMSVTLNLGTAVTQLTTSTLNQVGLCFARSLATTTTHTVSFGRYVGGTLYETATLRAGEAAVLRLASGTNYEAKGTSGSRLRVDITEG